MHPLSGAGESGRNGFSILAIIIITIFVLMGFYVLLKAYGFPTTVTLIFLIFAGLSGYFYLFVH
ncbi:hypothetical protein ATE47_01535 [Chryseobacterium sp. IHB B 17019]|nr:hypothetical protein ATE47_01535 [Chryseobacterium sp. IHB B 17019]